MSRIINLARPSIDYRMAHAISQVREDFGDIVDLQTKSKGLLKFGRSETIGTTLETVWQLDGDETYVTDNLITTISSSSAADTTTIVLEGHTVTGTGTDAQFSFAVQTVTLQGQTEVALTTPLARASRAFASGSTSLQGDVYVYQDDTVVAGVPQTPAKRHIIILGSEGENQSFKTATTFANGDYFFLTGFSASVLKKTTASVDVVLEVRRVGALFRPIAGRFSISSTGTTTQQFEFDPVIIVPKNADIRMRAVSSAASTEVNAQFQGYIALVVGSA